MPKLGFYDGLNGDSMWDPKFNRITIDDIVKSVDEANYGTHRFLTALVRLRKEKLAQAHAEGYDWEKDKLMEGIEKLLNDGNY
jgi:hypothetical protein